MSSQKRRPARRGHHRFSSPAPSSSRIIGISPYSRNSSSLPDDDNDDMHEYMTASIEEHRKRIRKRRTPSRKAEELSGIVDSLADATSQLAREESLILLERGTLQDKLLTVEQELRQSQLELSRERDAASALTETNGALVEQNDQLTSERSAAVRDLAEAQKELRILSENETEAFRTAEVLRVDRSTLRSQITEVEGRLSAEIFDLRTQLSRTKALVGQKEKNEAQLRDELEASVRESQELKNIELKSCALRNELVELRNELADSRATLAEQRTVAAEATASAEKATSEKEREERKNEHLSSSLDAQTEELHDVRASLRAEAEKGRQLQSARLEESDVLSKKIESIRHLEMSMERSRGEAAAAEEAHRREIERIRTEASAVERELKNAMERVEKTRDAFKAEAVALNESIQAQEGESAVVAEALRSERRKTEMLTNELSVMTSAAQAAASKDAEIVELKRALDVERDRVLSNERRLAASNQDVGDSEEKLRVTRESLAAVEVEVAQQRAEGARATAEYQEKVRKLKHSEATLKETNAQLQQKVKRLEEENSEANTSLQSARKRVASTSHILEEHVERGTCNRGSRLEQLQKRLGKMPMSSRFHAWRLAAAVLSMRLLCKKEEELLEERLTSKSKIQLAVLREEHACSAEELQRKHDGAIEALKQQHADAAHEHKEAAQRWQAQEEKHRREIEVDAQARIDEVQVKALSLETTLKMERVELLKRLEENDMEHRGQIESLTSEFESRIADYDRDSGLRSAEYDRRVVRRVIAQLSDFRRHTLNAFLAWRIWALLEGHRVEVAEVNSVMQAERENNEAELEKTRELAQAAEASQAAGEQNLKTQGQALQSTAKELADVRAALRGCEEQLAEATSQLETRGSEIDSLKDTLGAVTDERATLNESLAEETRILTKERSRTKELAKALQDVNTRLEETSDVLNTRIAELSVLKKQKVELSMQIEVLQNETVKASKAISTAERAMHRAEADGKHTRGELQKLQMVCDKRQEEVVRLRDVIEEMSRADTRLRTTVAKLSHSHDQIYHQQQGAKTRNIQLVVSKLLAGRPVKACFLRWVSAIRMSAAVQKQVQLGTERQAQAIAAISAELEASVRKKHACRRAAQAKVMKAKAWVKWRSKSHFICVAERMATAHREGLAEKVTEYRKQLDEAVAEAAQRSIGLALEVEKLKEQSKVGVSKAAELSSSLRASEEAQVLVQGELSQALYEKEISEKELEVAREKTRRLVQHLGEVQRRLLSWGLNPRAFLGGGSNGN
jgi:chromosome segregation ATPase